MRPLAWLIGSALMAVRALMEGLFGAGFDSDRFWLQLLTSMLALALALLIRQEKRP